MKRLIGVTAAALALALVAGPGAAKEWKKVRIGVEGAYPPFSSLAPDGKLVGFDIDITHALCQAMNTECTLVQQDWDGIIPALLARKYDAIVASMSITPERMKRVDFTDKYYQVPAKFVAKAGVNWADTNEGLKGKTVGVQRASIHQDYMEKRYPDVKLKLYGTQDEVYIDLVSTKIDAAMADSVAMLEGFINTDKGMGYAFFGRDHVDPQIHGEGIGIAVRKKDGDLREKLNVAMEKIRSSGEYDKIAKKYFDFDIYGAPGS